MVFTDDAAIDCFEKEPDAHFVVFDIFFDVLDGRVDRRDVHFFRRDAIVEREARFSRYLRDHAYRVQKPECCAFDRAVYLIRIERLFCAVTLCYGDHKAALAS